MHDHRSESSQQPSRMVRQARLARRETAKRTRALIFGVTSGPVFAGIALYLMLGRQGFVQGAAAMLKGAGFGFAAALVAPLFALKHGHMFRDVLQTLTVAQMLRTFLITAALFSLGGAVVALVFGTDLLDRVPADDKLLALFGVCLCTGGYAATGYWLGGRTPSNGGAEP